MVSHVSFPMGVAVQNNGNLIFHAELQHFNIIFPGVLSGTPGIKGTVVQFQQHMMFAGGSHHCIEIYGIAAVIRMPDDVDIRILYGPRRASVFSAIVPGLMQGR